VQLHLLACSRHRINWCFSVGGLVAPRHTGAVLAAIFVLLLGTLAIALGVGPLLTGRLNVGVKTTGWATLLANLWTIGATDTYSMRPFTARFVGLVLVALGATSVVTALRTLLSL
jgi:hypothetical protein